MTAQLKFRLFGALIILLFASSCKKKEAALDCGCDGSTYAKVENAEASYLGNGYFVINKIDQHDHLTYGWACVVDTNWTKSTDPGIYNYVISGNLKNRCPTPGDAFYSMLPGGPLQITSIRKNL